MAFVPRAAVGRIIPNPGYYGWVIVGLGFLCSALTSPGQSFVISLYLEPIMEDLGISRVEISTLFAFATLAAAACLPIVGGWADRIPSGRFLGGVLGLLALAMIGLSFVQTTVGLAVAIFAMRLLGQGAVGLGTITATVRWFRRYRGRALAIVGLGYAFGHLVFPGVVYGLQASVGWRNSLLVFAGFYLLLLAPTVGTLIRERRPDDDPVDGSIVAPGAFGEGVAATEVSFSLRDALGTPVFWGLLFCMGIVPLVQTALIFHQVAIFNWTGWGAGAVPLAFVAYALGGVVMTYSTGLVLERIPTRVGLVLSLTLGAVAIGAAAFPLPGMYGAILYGTLLGLASGAQSATGSILWPDYFGIDSLGAVKGVVSGVSSGATALGPPLAAILVASSGSFDGSLIVFALMCLSGAILAAWLRPPTAIPGTDLESGPDARIREPGAPHAA